MMHFKTRVINCAEKQRIEYASITKDFCYFNNNSIIINYMEKKYMELT